jgi:hypothetical protein
MVVAAVWFGCNNAARDIVGEWSIFQRERMVNLKLPSYVFSKLAVLFALCVFQCTLLLGIVTAACGLQADFLQTLAMLITASLVGTALGLAISAKATTTESAIALLPVVLLPIIALGGGLSPTYKMGIPARTASYLVPSRWALEANLLSESEQHDCGYVLGVTFRNTKCPLDEDPADAAKNYQIDAAEFQFPEWWVADANGQRVPAELPEGQESQRHTFVECIAALMTMLAALLSGVLVALRLRDVH